MQQLLSLNTSVLTLCSRVHSGAVLLRPCRRRQKRLQKLAKGKALKGKYRDMPLLGSMPPTVLGVTSEKFGDDLRRYLEGNPDHSLSSAESGMFQAGQRGMAPLLVAVSHPGGNLEIPGGAQSQARAAGLRWLGGDCVVLQVMHLEGPPGQADL